MNTLSVKIHEDVHYIGVNDRETHLFENMWPLDNGISYNSYLLTGEKNVLLDTVKITKVDSFLVKIQNILKDKPLDYLVIHHMEPDHSGSIKSVIDMYPDVKLVGNKKTQDFLEAFYGVTGNFIEIKEGDTLDLGDKKLTFYMTPMVHWPETMVTLDAKNKVLFSGDAFGCFGALNGGIIDTEINCETFWLEMVRYYSNIVGKYGIPVQNALKKLAGVELDYICSTHGPVWHEHIEKVIGMYDKMSKYETEPGLVICYGTMYGNTERMAEIIARAASKAGVKNIVMYNISKTHHSYILRDIFRYKGLIVGAPTYNAGLYHEMEVLLSELANKDVKNHLLGWYGSHCWASKAVAKIQEWNETKLHYEPVGEPVDMKQAITPEVKAQCEALGKAMAEKLLAE